MNKLYWVGTRQSDIDDIEELFQGSVTIFGSNTNGNFAYCTKESRINHNIDDPDCDLFFDRTLHSLCEDDPDVRFIFYNPVKAYQYDDTIRKHTLCLNDYELIDALSDKNDNLHPSCRTTGDTDITIQRRSEANRQLQENGLLFTIDELIVSIQKLFEYREQIKYEIGMC